MYAVCEEDAEEDGDVSGGAGDLFCVECEVRGLFRWGMGFHLCCRSSAEEVGG